MTLHRSFRERGSNRVATTRSACFSLPLPRFTRAVAQGLTVCLDRIMALFPRRSPVRRRDGQVELRALEGQLLAQAAADAEICVQEQTVSTTLRTRPVLRPTVPVALAVYDTTAASLSRWTWRGRRA